jgi:hypothetical protein
MNTTVTTTATEDFNGIVKAIKDPLKSAIDAATDSETGAIDNVSVRQNLLEVARQAEFRHNLRFAAFIYGTQEVVRRDAQNRDTIKNILFCVGYTAKDTERWFEAVEVQYGLRDALVAA